MKQLQEITRLTTQQINFIRNMEYLSRIAGPIFITIIFIIIGYFLNIFFEIKKLEDDYENVQYVIGLAKERLEPEHKEYEELYAKFLKEYDYWYNFANQLELKNASLKSELAEKKIRNRSLEKHIVEMQRLK